MKRDYRLFLKDIICAIDAIEKFTKNLSFDEFIQDDKTSSAVVRKFEIIGEATKNIPDFIREQYPAIPWKKMSGIRDVLIHGYFSIDYELVWGTIKTEIPKIKPDLIKILNELEENL